MSSVRAAPPPPPRRDDDDDDLRRALAASARETAPPPRPPDDVDAEIARAIAASIDEKEQAYVRRQKAALEAATRRGAAAPPPAPASLAGFLGRVGMGRHLALLRGEEIETLEDLSFLTVQDLVDVGLPQRDAASLVHLASV